MERTEVGPVACSLAIMPDKTSMDLPAELLANSAWMHALARSLVRGEEAEDLVQETWLRALRRAPDDPAQARGWLATVLQNLATTKARSEGRRHAREQSVARGEATDSTANVVERAGLHREVIEAVMALDEPCRKTILMRYFDELPPREIATRTGTPLATVKGRLARGLDVLRRELDERNDGDRRAWVMALVPLAREGGSVAPLLAIGAKGLVGAGVLVGLLGMALYLSGNRGESQGASEPEATAQGSVRDEGLRVPVQIPTRDQEARTQTPTPAQGAQQLEQAPLLLTPETRDDVPQVQRTERTPSHWWEGAQPPGLVRVPGGRTRIGTNLKQIVELFEKQPAAQDRAAGFLAETPEHLVDIDDFDLMVTEVTNEQYREFVQSAGARPPFLWASGALDAARRKFFNAYGERVKKAMEEGSPRPKSERFDEKDWWDKNWKGQEWNMPDEIATKPVVYVDYQNATAYARWAGLRLPTEFEFERAVRGDTNNNFPWGNEWKQELAATSEGSQAGEVNVVANFRSGTNEQGVFDLTGNVWEWTSSPYVEYPGWKHKTIRIGWGANAHEIDVMPRWSAQRRVVRGGSQSTPWIYARGSTRGGFDREQRASVLGLRCAASVVARGQRATVQRWSVASNADGPPGYEVITKHERVEFEALDGVTIDSLFADDDPSGALPIGHFACDVPFLEPRLSAGSYSLTLRRELRAGVESYAVEFFTGDGQHIATLPVDSARATPGGTPSARVVERTQDGQAPLTLLELELLLPGERRRDLAIQARLVFAPGVRAVGWR